MADEIITPEDPTPASRPRRRAAGRPAGPPQPGAQGSDAEQGEPGGSVHTESPSLDAELSAPGEETAAQEPPESPEDEHAELPQAAEVSESEAESEAAAEAAAGAPGPSEPADEPRPSSPRVPRRASRPAGAATAADFRYAGADEPDEAGTPETDPGYRMAPAVVTFQAPPAQVDLVVAAGVEPDEATAEEAAETTASEEETGSRRRRRGRRGRGRARSGEGDETEESAEATEASEPPAAAGRKRPASSDQAAGEEPPAPARSRSEAARPDEELDTATNEADLETEAGPATSGSHRRRRRRRRAGSGGGAAEDLDPDEPAVPVRVRAPRSRDSDQVRGLTGSTRLEAKRQRRREVRDQGRRRAPIVTEAEFLARREAVERVMVVRNAGERTQIAVLEDGMLVEHYVTRATATSYAGNVYLGRVQNVLPSMEAAFVDVGKGRNAVLYAGEVNYDASALEGKPPKIEQALKSGQSVVVQVTKDPIGHKGARLTSQVSLPGRYMVYVPGGASAGISRKLPDTERSRLKAILRRITPDDAGVIVRTAAEGASEEELARDVERLQGQWKDIQRKAGRATAPALLYAEPDLVVRVVRDIFNEDFTSLVVQGAEEWETINSYVRAVAPDLADRVVVHEGEQDVFAAHRVDEQLLKALDRKVWLPSGGSLILDRTEAMTVIDVNTGRYTGKGGNLEETVTRNNLEAAEEVVRQLRLRDIGGIIVIDFVDMVLESNRELLLRRLTECLGRDRTKHQVAEMTSLGLVQMTRKRVGQGLVEAFSETCSTCGGRGLIILSLEPNGPPKSRQLKPLPSGLIPQALQTPGGAAAAATAGRTGAGLEAAAAEATDSAEDDTAAADDLEAADDLAADTAEDIPAEEIEPVDLRRDPVNATGGEGEYAERPGADAASPPSS